jgi:hypothetical protein
LGGPRSAWLPAAVSIRDLAHAAPPPVSSSSSSHSFLLLLFVLHLLYYRTSVCEPRGVQREHGAALATNGNLVTGAADAHDGTGRAEEGGQHLFLAVSTAIRTHAGVVEEYEVVFLGHDVTPDPRLSSDPSISKGHLIAGHLVFARTGSQIPQKCLSVATK